MFLDSSLNDKQPKRNCHFMFFHLITHHVSFLLATTLVGFASYEWKRSKLNSKFPCKLKYMRSAFSPASSEIKFMKNCPYSIIIFTFLVIIFILPIGQSLVVDFSHVIGFLWNNALVLNKVNAVYHPARVNATHNAMLCKTALTVTNLNDKFFKFDNFMIWSSTTH